MGIFALLLSNLGLKQKDRNLEKIVEYAEICRVKPLLQTWLNAMI